MKKLLLLLTLTLCPIAFAMDLNLDQLPDTEFITFALANNQTEKIPKKLVVQSETLKKMIEELDPKEALPFPDLVLATFDLIKPYFKWANLDFAKSINRENDKLEALRKKLDEHPDKELADIINASNYLDMPVIHTVASALMARRVDDERRIKHQIENDLPLIPDLTNDMNKLCAQQILQKKSELKHYWLLQEALENSQGNTKIIPTNEFHLHCINKEGTLGAAVYENRVALFDLKIGQKLSEFTTGQPNAYLRAMAFSPTGTFLIAGDDNADVYIWDIRKPKRAILSAAHPPLHGDSPVYQACFSPNGSLLAFTGYQNIYIYNLEKRELRNFPLMGAHRICFDKTNTLLAVACNQDSYNKIHLFDVQKGVQIVSSPYLPPTILWAIQFTHDGNLITVHEKHERLNACYRLLFQIINWRVNDKIPFNTHTSLDIELESSSNLRSARLSDDGLLLAVRNSNVALYSTQNGKKIDHNLVFNATSIYYYCCFNSPTSLIACPTNIASTHDWNKRAIHLISLIKPESELQKWLENGIKAEQVILLDKIRDLKLLPSVAMPLNKLQPYINKANLPYAFRKLIGQTSYWERAKEKWNNLSQLSKTGIAATSLGLTGYAAYHYLNRHK